MFKKPDPKGEWFCCEALLLCPSHCSKAIVTVVCCVEEMRKQQRLLKKTNRDLDRDRHAMERQERQLVSCE